MKNYEPNENVTHMRHSDMNKAQRPFSLKALLMSKTTACILSSLEWLVSSLTSKNKSWSQLSSEYDYMSEEHQFMQLCLITDINKNYLQEIIK